MAKIGMPIERSLLARLQTEKGVLGDYERDGQWKIYYTRKLSHFVQILDFIPTIKDERGQTRRPSELKEIAFGCQQHRDVFLSILNSSLFYWLLTVFSDCRNLNRRDIGFARFDLANAEAQTIQRLQKLCTALMAHIRANAKMLTMQYKRLGELRIQCTYPKMSKHILNDIDRILAQHYGFTDEELDFIINYDIKYRMGADGGDAEDK